MEKKFVQDILRCEHLQLSSSSPTKTQTLSSPKSEKARKRDLDNFVTRKLSLADVIIYLSSVSIIDNVSCSFTNQQCVKTKNPNQIFLFHVPQKWLEWEK